MRVLVSVLLLAATLRAQPPNLPNTEELEQELKRFLDVFVVLRDQSADPLDLDAAFYHGAIPGMLRTLDPHSVFFDREQYEQLREMQKSVAKGFGSVVSVLPGRVIVLQTMNGSPSQKAGLAPGDEILAVNNIALQALTLDQLIEVLGATRQSQAHLVVKRPGTAGLMNFTLTPAELQAPSVDRAFLIAPGVGYVRATSFDEDTGTKLKDAIESLGGEKLKGLVLDLRDNPGGVVTSALDAASLFLKPGQRLLAARGRSSKTQEIDAPPLAHPYPFRMAVLVNGKTASAAEIVSGALQDHDRATVIGEPTFGKGLVQSVSPLHEGTGLALTTAFYYTPSGRSIQRPLRSGELSGVTQVKERPLHKTDSGRPVRGGGGIEPDIVVEPPPPSRLMYVLEASASFPNFATEYTRRVKPLPEDFDITSAILDEFRAWCSERRIRPGVADWTVDRDYIASRVKQEILNQGRSVAAGDEVEFKRDPVVRRAVQELSSATTPTSK